MHAPLRCPARGKPCSQPWPAALPRLSLGAVFSRKAPLAPRFSGIGAPEVDPDVGPMVAKEYKDTPCDLLAEAQLRVWLGATSTRAIKTKKMTTGVKGADASLCVCGTIIEVNDFQHALMAVVVKENTNTQKLNDMFLHWATAQREGGQWVPPPLGCTQYPSKLISDMPGCGAWRTPFAVHACPDGKPLHVAMIQVPLDGVLRTGGVSFVLNAGPNNSKWCHNAHHGGNWYVQLTGNFPLTAAEALEQLPDAEVYPASLAPPPSAEEAADRKLLQARPKQVAELEQQKRSATELADAAAKVAQEAAAVLARAREESARRASEVAAAQQQAAALTKAVEAEEAAVTAAAARVEVCDKEASSTTTTGWLSLATSSPSRDLAAAAAAPLAGTAGIAANDDDDEPRFLPSPVDALAAAAAAKAALAAAKAALEAAETALHAKRGALRVAGTALRAAEHAAAVASVERAAVEDAERRASEASRQQAASAAAVCAAVAKEMAALDKVCAEATARVWAHVEARQLLALKRFVAETGPKEPLNLAWLLAPSLSGRSLPLVPTPFNGVKNINGDVEIKESWAAAQKLEPCSVEDLQSVMRSNLRKWLNMSPAQELHVVQYRCTARLPNGSELPVLVWMSDSENGFAWAAERPEVTLVVAVDQSAAGSRSGRVQLHWGAAMREGLQPSELVGAGWRTSSPHSWESAGCTLVTPLTAQRVPKLHIGRLRGAAPPAHAGIQVVSGDYCTVSVGGSPHSGDAAAVSPDLTTEKQAHVAILHLPLEGMLLHGGLSFTLKDSLGQHLHSASTGKPFFLELGMMLQQLAYAAQPRVYVDEPAEELLAEEQASEAASEEAEAVPASDATAGVVK